MNVNKVICLLAGVAVISTSLVSMTASTRVSASNRLTTTSTLAQANRRAAVQRPPTKTATISVEGEPTQVSLKLYQQASPQFSTYYPDQFFVPETVTSGEGKAITFYVNTTRTINRNAYIRFSFLNKSNSLGQIRKLVNDKRGVIASNGWKVTSRTTRLPYSWAKEKISFQQNKTGQNFVASIILGESKGKAFYVVTYYPAEYGDGFAPRASLIFQNLQF